MTLLRRSNKELPLNSSLYILSKFTLCEFPDYMVYNLLIELIENLETGSKKASDDDQGTRNNVL